MADFHELAELAEQQHGVLTASQLSRAGYSARMVRTMVDAGRLKRKHRGVLVLGGSASTWERDLLAGVFGAGATACASHRAASRLWGLRSVDDEIELSIRFPRRCGIDTAIVHRSRDLETDDITVVSGIPVTTPERTICDLGLIFPEHEVYRMLRHAVAVELVTPRDLWLIRQRTSKQGRNGTGVLERVLKALPEYAAHTDSGLEVMFLEACKTAGLSTPSLQVPVVVGGRRYRLDFAWPTAQVFVEIDGAQFHSSVEQIANDTHRQNLLVAAGWTPVRFRYEALRDRPRECVRILESALGICTPKLTA